MLEEPAKPASPRVRSASILRRDARHRPCGPGVIDLAIATLAVLLIASPLLFTSDGFAPDFTNAIWLAAYQQHVIAAHLYPTLFLQTQKGGVFDPEFAFYGGTLFAITGALGVALGGSTISAFTVLTVAAIAAAYGGLFWFARQVGVRGLTAHAPAIVFVTSAYYVAVLYGKGAWAEFMAVSMLPLVLAASLRLARGRWRLGPVLCLVAATVVFSGSHNITLLWGSTLAVVALVLYWLLSGRSRELPWRRIVGVAGLIALGVGVNGWFLLPDVSYAHDTSIAADNIPWSLTAFMNTPGVVFDPLRTVPRNAGIGPAVYVQAPVLALVWGLIALPVVWRDSRLRAGAATALVVLGGLLVLIMSSEAWSLLPSFFQQIQFAFRLQTYVTLACAALVLLGALALTRRAESGRATRVDRSLALGLGLVVAFSLSLAVWQLWVPNTHVCTPICAPYSNRADALRGPPTLEPKTWYETDDYGDHSLPVVKPTSSWLFPPQAVTNDRLVAAFPANPGPTLTNIMGGPYLVHVGGSARVVGRFRGGGYLMIERVPGNDGAIEISPRLSAPVVLGRITTAASAALLLALAAIAAVRRRRWHSPH